MALESINPANGNVIAQYPSHDAREIDAILASTRAAGHDWRAESYPTRADRLRHLAASLEGRRDELAALMAAEMGKVLREARAEVDKCAWACRFYAEEGERFLAPEPVATDASRSYVTFRPLGIVLGVMPWNFPLWQVYRFAVPSLMAGNAAVLKHASNVSGCALAIERSFRESGFPEHLFRCVLVDNEAVGNIIADDRIDAVTLTGSTPAGRAVASRAGKALKKTVLELGGSDPYVILEDADLESTVEACAVSRLINAGQSCIAAKRFIVVDAVRDEFEQRFAERMRRCSMGDPTDEATDIGPMARRDLRDGLHRQVTASVDSGARLLLGGESPAGPGSYYPPTVLTEVTPGMPAFDEELFGPVAAITPVPDEEAAIVAANRTVFGLGAAVFTADEQRGERIAAERLEAGSCFVNAFVRSDPRLPFGGIKASGYGRELAGFGIREFVNIKTVYIR